MLCFSSKTGFHLIFFIPSSAYSSMLDKIFIRQHKWSKMLVTGHLLQECMYITHKRLIPTALRLVNVSVCWLGNKLTSGLTRHTDTFSSLSAIAMWWSVHLCRNKELFEINSIIQKCRVLILVNGAFCHTGMPFLTNGYLKSLKYYASVWLVISPAWMKSSALLS